MCLSLTITVDLDLLKQGFPIYKEMASHFAIQLEVAFVSQTVLHTFICLCVMLWINENSSEDYCDSVHTYYTVLVSIQLSMWETFTSYIPSISTS